MLNLFWETGHIEPMLRNKCILDLGWGTRTYKTCGGNQGILNLGFEPGHIEPGVGTTVY